MHEAVTPTVSSTIAWGDATIFLESTSRAVLREIIDYLSGSMKITPATDPEPGQWQIMVRDVPQPAWDAGQPARDIVIHDFGPDSVVGKGYADGRRMIVREPSQGAVITVDVPGRRLVVEGPHRHGTLYPRRQSSIAGVAHEIVRGVLRVLNENSGGVVVHGAAAAFGDEGLLLIGGKGAGKSTLLLALLRRCGADYLSGDRVLLRTREQSSRISGWPTTLRLNAGTLAIFDELSPTAADASAQALSGRPRKAHVWPGDIASVIGTTTRPEAALRAVVLVGGGTGAPSDGVRSCTPAEAMSILRHNVFTPDDPAHPNWLGIPHRERADLEAAVEATLQRVSASTQLLRLPVCGWQAHDLERQATSVVRAVQGPASPATTARAVRPAVVLPSRRGPVIVPSGA